MSLFINNCINHYNDNKYNIYNNFICMYNK